MANRIDRMGDGVSKEAQDIFDRISKTMEVKWKGTSILVMNMVEIQDPYMLANCRSEDETALNRVKTVLAGERRILGLASGE